MRVAILEDDEDIGHHIEKLMSDDGHEALKYGDGASFLHEFPTSEIDLLLLDWGLPDMSGPDVIAKIRTELEGTLPVILITGRAGVGDIVEGLASGADDFISKPVTDNVLRARVAAVARRAYGAFNRPSEERYGQYRFHLSRREIACASERLPATDKEFALALLLFRNLERPVSRAQITEAVWGYHPGTDSRTLDIHISRIRHNLQLLPENGLRLSAIPGFGYRLEAIGNDRPRRIHGEAMV